MNTKLLQTIIIAAAILGSVYIILLFIKSQNENIYYQQNLKYQQRLNARQDCFNLADSNYRDAWDFKVKWWGSKDNTLPKYIADELKADLDNDYGLCVKMYPVD